jgi:hypothetical protein
MLYTHDGQNQEQLEDNFRCGYEAVMLTCKRCLLGAAAGISSPSLGFKSRGSLSRQEVAIVNSIGGSDQHNSLLLVYSLVRARTGQKV